MKNYSLFKIANRCIWLLDHPKVSLPLAAIVGIVAGIIDTIVDDFIEMLHWM